MKTTNNILTKLFNQCLYMSKPDLISFAAGGGLCGDLEKSAEPQEKSEYKAPEWVQTVASGGGIKQGKRLDKYTWLNEETGIATMFLHGVVYKGIDWELLNVFYRDMVDFIKAIDADLVIPAINNLKNNKNVLGVVIDINSPGGMVVGTSEMGDAIVELRKVKPVCASVDMMAASAGFWLMAACGYSVVSPSARVGSVGVYMAWLDETGWLEKMGLKIELIKAGKLKAIGVGSLDEGQRKFLQKSVDKSHAEFKAFVRSALSDFKIEDALLEGQAIPAKDVKGKLVDELASQPLLTAIKIIKNILDK